MRLCRTHLYYGLSTANMIPHLLYLRLRRYSIIFYATPTLKDSPGRMTSTSVLHKVSKLHIRFAADLASGVCILLSRSRGDLCFQAQVHNTANKKPSSRSKTSYHLRGLDIRLASAGPMAFDSLDSKLNELRRARHVISDRQLRID